MEMGICLLSVIITGFLRGECNMKTLEYESSRNMESNTDYKDTNVP